MFSSARAAVSNAAKKVNRSVGRIALFLPIVDAGIHAGDQKPEVGE